MKSYHTKPKICKALFFTGDTQPLLQAKIAFKTFPNLNDNQGRDMVEIWDQATQDWVYLPENVYLVEQPGVEGYFYQNKHNFEEMWVEDGPVTRSSEAIFSETNDRSGK